MKLLKIIILLILIGFNIHADNYEKHLMAYTVDYFGKVTKIDLNEFKIIRSEKYFDDNSFESCMIEITPNGKKIFISGVNKKEPSNPLIVFESEKLIVLDKIYLPIRIKEGDLPPQVFGLQMVPDGKKILISYQFDPIEFKSPTYIIDTNNYKILNNNNVYFRNGESDPAFSKDFKLMYVASAYSPLRVLNLDTYEVKEKWIVNKEEKLIDGSWFSNNILLIYIDNSPEKIKELKNLFIAR